VTSGPNNDYFNDTFGPTVAPLARSIIDSAINLWTRTITNLNQTGSNNNLNVTISMNSNAMDTSTGASASVTYNSQTGFPISAGISFGRTADSHGGGWFLDANIFSSAFLGVNKNDIAGYAQTGSPAAAKSDLLEVATHELGHALGLIGGATSLRPYFHDTGVADHSSSNGIGHYWAFTGPTGYTALMTGYEDSNNSDAGSPNHYAALGDPAYPISYNGQNYYGADDVLNAFFTNGQRRLVSRNDAYILRDAYGYTVNDPDSFGTWYSVLDSSGKLTVRGRLNASSNDVITLDMFTVLGLTFVSTSVSLGTPVPGTGYSGAYTDTFLASNISSIEIDTGPGNCAVNLNRTPNVSMTVNLGDGVDTVNISPLTKSLNSIQGSINVHGGFGFDTLNVFDDSSAAASTYTLTASTITRTGSPVITFGNQGMNSVVVNGGSGNNTYIVNGTESSYATTINTGSGADTVNIRATGVGGTLTVDTPTGSASSISRVTIGNAGSLAGIQGAVTIHNTPARDPVTIDDSNDGGNHPAVSVTSGGVSGLAPAAINFTNFSVSTLSLLGGFGTNTYTVNDTPVHTSMTLDSGSSADRIKVLGTTQPLTVHSSFVDFVNSNTVNVGNGGGLQNIRGSISITNNNFSTTAVNVDDSGDSTTRTGTISATSVTGLGMAAGAAVNYAGVQLASLTVTAGGGVGNTINVESTQAGMTTTVNGGSGGSTINLSPTAHNLANLAGLLAVHGQGGTNTLNSHDEAATFSQEQVGENLYQDHLTRVDVPGVEHTVFTYMGIQSLNAFTGHNDNIFNVSFGVESTPAGTNVVVSNASTHNIQFVVQGFSGTLDSIQGPVTLHSRQAGADELVINDAPNNPQSYTVTATTVRFRSNLPPLTYDNPSSVVLRTSAQAPATVNVQSTAASTSFYTRLDLGAAGSQAILGDQGSVANLRGEVFVRPLDVPVSVTVDDSADPMPRTVTLTADASVYNLDGLAPAVIAFTPFSGSSMQVLGGSGGNTFNVQSLLSGTTLALNGGSGTNTLDYSAYTGNVIVDLQTGFATGIAGGLSGNFVNVHGANNSGSGLYNLLIGNGGGVTLTGGTGRRNILVAGASAATLNGGTQDDLLIGGTTSYDTEAGLVSWQAVAAYWAGANNTDDFGTRVSNLESDNGVPLLDATTVTGNGGGNTMTGLGELALIYTDGADTISGFDPNSQTYTITP
jgi:hypothetical protein